MSFTHRVARADAGRPLEGQWYSFPGITLPPRDRKDTAIAIISDDLGTASPTCYCENDQVRRDARRRPPPELLEAQALPAFDGRPRLRASVTLAPWPRPSCFAIADRRAA